MSGVVITPTDEQMADPEFQRAAAESYAEKILEEQRKELGAHVGRRFPISISLAMRISGFSEKWIRRNLPIVKAERQNDSIEFGGVVDAIEQRRDK